ncbi:MAG: hypothetical protein LBR07_07850, partial [Puniceicoccales bacterium]|nr:hypothetical protein [Puniceicoccales bacterium]
FREVNLDEGKLRLTAAATNGVFENDTVIRLASDNAVALLNAAGSVTTPGSDAYAANAALGTPAYESGHTGDNYYLTTASTGAYKSVADARPAYDTAVAAFAPVKLTFDTLLNAQNDASVTRAAASAALDSAQASVNTAQRNADAAAAKVAELKATIDDTKANLYGGTRTDKTVITVGSNDLATLANNAAAALIAAQNDVNTATTDYAAKQAVLGTPSVPEVPESSTGAGDGTPAVPATGLYLAAEQAQAALNAAQATLDAAKGALGTSNDDADAGTIYGTYNTVKAQLDAQTAIRNNIDVTIAADEAAITAAAAAKATALSEKNTADANLATALAPVTGGLTALQSAMDAHADYVAARDTATAAATALTEATAATAAANAAVIVAQNEKNAADDAYTAALAAAGGDTTAQSVVEAQEAKDAAAAAVTAAQTNVNIATIAETDAQNAKVAADADAAAKRAARNAAATAAGGRAVVVPAATAKREADEKSDAYDAAAGAEAGAISQKQADLTAADDAKKRLAQPGETLTLSDGTPPITVTAGTVLTLSDGATTVTPGTDDLVKKEADEAANLSAAQGVVATAENAKDTADSDNTTAQGNLSAAQGDAQAAQTTLATANTAAANAAAAKTAADTALSSATTTLASATTQLGNENDTLAGTAYGDLAVAGAALAAANAAKTTPQTNYEAANAAYETAAANLNAYVNSVEYKTAKEAYDKAKSAFDTYIAAVNHLIEIIENADAIHENRMSRTIYLRDTDQTINASLDFGTFVDPATGKGIGIDIQVSPTYTHAAGDTVRTLTFGDFNEEKKFLIAGDHNLNISSDAVLRFSKNLTYLDARTLYNNDPTNPAYADYATLPYSQFTVTGGGTVEFLSTENTFRSLDVTNGTLLVSPPPTPVPYVLSGEKGLLGQTQVTIDGSASHFWVIGTTANENDTIVDLESGARVKLTNSGSLKVENATFALRHGQLNLDTTGVLDFRGKVVVGSTRVINAPPAGVAFGGNVAIIPTNPYNQLTGFDEWGDAYPTDPALGRLDFPLVLQPYSASVTQNFTIEELAASTNGTLELKGAQNAVNTGVWGTITKRGTGTTVFKNTGGFNTNGAVAAGDTHQYGENGGAFAT